jgi:hypothetical protein
MPAAMAVTGPQPFNESFSLLAGRLLERRGVRDLKVMPIRADLNLKTPVPGA